MDAHYTKRYVGCNVDGLRHSENIRMTMPLRRETRTTYAHGELGICKLNKCGCYVRMSSPRHRSVHRLRNNEDMRLEIGGNECKELDRTALNKDKDICDIRPSKTVTRINI